MQSIWLVLLLSQSAHSGWAQTAGTVRGTVTLEASGDPLHHASVTVGRTGRVAETGEDGKFEISGIPAGTYSIHAHLQSLSDDVKSVTIRPGEVVTVDFKLRLASVRQSLTVTATEKEQTTFESFQTVTSLDAVDLALKSKPSLGELLENQPGVAKRSFGPGSSRPVIRGFDGDRVLVMQDGIPTSSLSSQSGDHGESLDPSSLDRLEVVKGPATLLYGSNAIGGAVNAVTGHHQIHDHPHQGLRGYATGFGGTANGQAGGAAGFDLGLGNWLVWGNGSGQRTGDYTTPRGKVDNSRSRLSNSSGGLSWFGSKTSFDIGYRYEEGKYGVPFAGEFHGEHEEEAASKAANVRTAEEEGHEDHEHVSLAFRRHNVRIGTGWKDLDFALPSFRLSINYADWQHKELEEDVVGTLFRNKQITYRGVFQQRKTGNLTGSFGFQGSQRAFKTTGEEALAPPVDQNNIAVFGLEEFSFERFRLQFGGRIDNTRYKPDGLRDRSFTGASGAAGIYIPTWKNGAVVTNFTSSFRAPALEELYNLGPHIGNLTYEIGNSALRRERSNGVDFSLRHNASKVRAEANFFYYGISNFVYLAPNGEEEDGLVAADYNQGDSRFTGTELGLDVGLHQKLWLNLGMDYVNAELKSGSPLPRIPPLRGRAGFDFRSGNLSIRPEIRMASSQERLFETETSTAGYTVFNLNGSYTVTRQHVAHIFGADAFNLGNRLYFNHLSFIKDHAPEIGRGIRFTYTLRFF
ncbi:MAG: TonB-dependent receptor [Bryobacterales bacterium]|nr:TonB-dependent receptor [Bryobacterales bacterium]